MAGESWETEAGDEEWKARVYILKEKSAQTKWAQTKWQEQGNEVMDKNSNQWEEYKSAGLAKRLKLRSRSVKQVKYKQ